MKEASMFPREKGDLPLAGGLAVLAVAATVIFWPRGDAGASTEAAVASAVPARVASAPADYAAPPLPGTTADALPRAGTLVDIVRPPADLPAPVGARGPRRVDVHLHTTEVTGTLADGTTYAYWTFNGKVPGPFVRVRVGDMVTVHLANDSKSMMMHNVDFHAVIGPGGGGEATMAGPGEQRSFTFKATTAGLYVYHCATMPHAQHIANGMYGMILVEPAGGLPKVDREFYVMQGEIYTAKPFGTTGPQTASYDRLLAETPDYFVFNGAVGALTSRHPLKAKVGERVRIFFGDAGPNKDSSFHVIGEIFDTAYDLGSAEMAPMHGIQTLTVPPGGAAIAEFTLRVPGTYKLVDHAISRVERGLVGALEVSGPANPEIFKEGQQSMSVGM
jgi:nitrite reductase (NO-forming)